jgi:glycosyltransferase involved in cell wall biosynthesis
VSNDSDRATQIVVVAQIPPPIHGQAVANELLVRGDYPDIEITHVPMAMSDDLASVGRFRPAKIVRALHVARDARRAARSTEGALLYYAVGMRNRVALYRDLLVLLLVRPAFRRTVFHVHSGGTGAFTRTRNPVLRRLVHRAYGGADVVVYLDRSLEDLDGGLPDAQATRYLPYGIEVPGGIEHPERDVTRTSAPVQILFVGNLYESKGTHDLVRAVAAMADDGLAVRLVMCGAFPDEDAHRELDALVDRLGVRDQVDVRGPVDADGKWSAMRDADIFCFPTYYEAEGMPLVIIEALAAGLPVVTTRWRAVPRLVTDDRTGYLVEPRDVASLTDRLSKLVRGPDLRAVMGRAARESFEQTHTVERYRASFAEIVREVVRGHATV